MLGFGSARMSPSLSPPARVIFEAHAPGDSSSLFRLLVDDKIVGESPSVI
jgi:hypothetical protein